MMDVAQKLKFTCLSSLLLEFPKALRDFLWPLPKYFQQSLSGTAKRPIMKNEQFLEW